MRTCLIVLLLLSATAVAQTPTPTPMPPDDEEWDIYDRLNPPRRAPPVTDDDDEWDSREVRDEPARSWEFFPERRRRLASSESVAADAFAHDADRPRRFELPRTFGEPAFAPTFAFAVGGRRVKGHPELDSPSLDFWLGGRMHPMVGPTSPFVALGAEMSFRTDPRLDPMVSDDDDERMYAEVVPELRYGIAFMRKPYGGFANTVFPDVEIYGITGWRIANHLDGNALRLGAGISAPILLRESAKANTLVPSMFEVTMDVDSAVSGERDFAFRVGWHF